MNDTFMKEKPIFPLLTSMALPMVVSMLVNALYNIVDSLFVARISEEAMTALSLVYPVQNLINAIAIGFSIGIAALISLHLGAGNKEKADMAATHGMVLSLIHGVVISIVCTAIMPRFLRSFTSDETVIAMGVTYSRVAFMFAVVIMAAMSLCLFGAMIGLWIADFTIGLTSVLGFITLLGMIVRNVILMYQHAEDKRKVCRWSAKLAAYDAGKRRMVPIFLTTATTAVGVVPMMLGGSTFWAPVGLTIFAGGIGSLILVVTILPVLYSKIYK